MSLYQAVRFFEEMAEPVDTQEGVVSPAVRRVRMLSNLLGWGDPASVTTAGNHTITAAQLLNGVIVRDPNGAARTDTLPTAGLLVAALLPGVRVGDLVIAEYINGADAAEPITIAAGTDGAFKAAQTVASRVVPQNAGRTIIIRITGVTTPAYEVYIA